MPFDCYCEYERPTFYDRRVVTARKRHRCEECSRVIEPGQRYEYASGLWEDCFGVFKTCIACVNGRDFLQTSLPCFCWAHGNLREDIRLALEDARYRAPEEMRGVAFRLGRIVIAERRKMEAA